MPGIAAVDTRHTEPLEQRRARQGQLFVDGVAGVAGVAGEESAAASSAVGSPLLCLSWHLTLIEH